MVSSIKTPVGDAPVIPVVILISGLYLAWFGVHYWRSDVKYPTTPVKDVLQGKGVTDPGSKPQPESIFLESAVSSASASEASSGGGSTSGGGGSAPASGGSSGSAIASDALKYKGAGYVWGGNASKPGDWDCSSFVSYVLGHDLGMPLPGGKWGNPGFPPHSHGPTTISYLLFGSALNNKQVAAGDLVVYNTHMGIAISNTEMISARDPRDGTGVDSIASMTKGLGEIPHFRRVHG